MHARTSMCTYRSHSCHVCTHILHTFLHTRLLHAKVHMRMCQCPGWLHAPLWACLLAHTCGRSCLCVFMLPFLCTRINGLVPVDTHTHTHTQVAHNSSYKCAGTKVKGTNSTGLRISSGWGGAHDSLHLPPHGWTRPLPLPHKGTFNSGQ